MPCSFTATTSRSWNGKPANLPAASSCQKNPSSIPPVPFEAKRQDENHLGRQNTGPDQRTQPQFQSGGAKLPWCMRRTVKKRRPRLPQNGGTSSVDFPFPLTTRPYSILPTILSRCLQVRTSHAETRSNDLDWKISQRLTRTGSSSCSIEKVDD